MDALYFLLDTLLGLAMVAVLLRLLMQWARADFRNPVGQAVLQLTNPVLVPLRRLLPAMGRIDTATVTTLVLLAAVRAALPHLLHGGLPLPHLWLLATVRVLAQAVLYFYLVAILVYALLGMLSQGVGYSPVQALLHDLCEPLLVRIRRVIPPLANLDFSPLWALIAIQTLLYLLA